MTSPANRNNHDTSQDSGQLLLTGTTNHSLKGKVIGNNILSSYDVAFQRAMMHTNNNRQIQTCSSNVYSALSTDNKVTKAVRMSDLLRTIRELYREAIQQWTWLVETGWIQFPYLPSRVASFSGLLAPLPSPGGSSLWPPPERNNCWANCTRTLLWW